ncbi:MAG: hypothetical protein D6806_18070 [Deltaproteobacteria bacterium]|nr:MAG: hypothetical protein D6806_18070 [Deltaproteobacteria bacterium]
MAGSTEPLETVPVGPAAGALQGPLPAGVRESRKKATTNMKLTKLIQVIFNTSVLSAARANRSGEEGVR